MWIVLFQGIITGMFFMVRIIIAGGGFFDIGADYALILTLWLIIALIWIILCRSLFVVFPYLMHYAVTEDELILRFYGKEIYSLQNTSDAQVIYEIHFNDFTHSSLW